MLLAAVATLLDDKDRLSGFENCIKLAGRKLVNGKHCQVSMVGLEAGSE